MMFELISDASAHYIAGVILLVLLSYMPILSIGITNHERRVLIFVLFVVVTAHHFLSLWNIFYWPLPGADLDAFNFHRNAQNGVTRGEIPKIAIGTDLYEYILYRFYSLFGDKLLIGQLVSVVLASVGCVAVLHMARSLNITNFKLLVMLIVMVGLAPSFLYFTSLTFRESFQVLFFIIGVAFALLAVRRKSLNLLFFAMISLVTMGLFHHMLLVVAVILSLIMAIFYAYINRKEISHPYIGLIVIASIIIFSGYWIIISAPVTGGNDYLRILRETGGFIEMIDRYRGSVEETLPRSTFGYSVNTDSISKLIIGLSKSYISYLFGPDIMSLKGAVDIVPFVNSLWRIISIFFIAFLIIRYNFKLKWEFLYLGVNYFIMTFIWSVGTTNYGQALRHNALTDWMLALMLIYLISYEREGFQEK